MTTRYVVTGAAGLIGQALVERLVDCGASVVAVDAAAFEANCAQHRLDLTKPGALTELLDESTTVFHLAGLTSVAGSVRDPQRDFAVNVGGFLNVLESARETSARVVFTSSASVFDPRSPLPHRESAPKSPNSPYAAAKLAGEGYCAAYFKCYGLDVRVARLFNVYGPGMTRFAIYDIYRKICEAEDALEILGDGDQVRDYLYLTDVVEGLLLIAGGGDPGEDYNLAAGVATTSRELAELMLEVMGRESLAIRTSGQTFPGDVRAWYADLTKIRGIGFQPRVGLREGLRRTIESFDLKRSSSAAVAKT